MIRLGYTLSLSFALFVILSQIFRMCAQDQVFYIASLSAIVRSTLLFRQANMHYNFPFGYRRSFQIPDPVNHYVNV